MNTMGMMGLLINIALWVVVFVTSGIVFWALLIVAILATFYMVYMAWYWYSSPWRRLFFPLMRRYALLGGAHVEFADLEGRPFTPKRPLCVLLREIQPAFTDEEREFLTEKWESEFKSFTMEPTIREIFSMERPDEVDRRLQSVKTAMYDPANYNAFFVRYAMGEIIGAKLGPHQKKHYWRALLRGDVS